MARRAQGITLGIDGATLLAADIAVAGGRVEIRRLVSAPLPEGVDRADAAAVGAWIARTLSENGMSARRVTFVARRDEVVLKRLSVPGGAALSTSELTGLVRLAMSRQMTMAIEGAGVDHVVVDGAGDGQGQATVLAAAMPADRMAWYRAVAGAAGAKINGIELGIGGVLPLVRDLAERRGGAVLAIWIGLASVEFVVLEDGQAVTGRAVDVRRPDANEDPEPFAARVVVEARRTWMGWNAGRDSAGLEAVAIVGTDPVAERVAARCQDSALASAVEVVGLPATVSFKGERPAALGAFLPMIGVGVRWAEGIDGFDFTRTRRGPDPKARRRQLVLAAMLGLIVVCGACGVAWHQRLGELRVARDGARSRMQKLGEQYADLLVVEARANAIEHWASAGVDWLSHLRWLSEQMPDPKDGLVDEVSGSVSADVRFTPRDRNLPGGQWSTNQQAVFSLSGRVVRRDVALDLRGRLVRGDVYRVINQTADTEDRFSFELNTARRSPFDPAPTGAAETGTGGGAKSGTPGTGGGA